MCFGVRNLLDGITDCGLLMAKKAKNAPPWTRKKLFRYRSAQQKQREEERKTEMRHRREREKSGAVIDRAMRGVAE